MVGREIKLLVRLAQLPDTYFLREPKMGCFPSLKHMYVSEPFDKKPQEQSARKKLQGGPNQGIIKDIFQLSFIL